MEESKRFKTSADLAKERLVSMGSGGRAELADEEARKSALARIADLRRKGDNLTEIEQQELVGLERRMKPQGLQ
jgi:hypothetical protein